MDRPGNKLRVTIRTSRPGIIIGRKGAEIEKLKGDLAKKTKREVFIDIQEVHKPELDAQLVAESIALQLEKRVAFRRAMRKAVDSALRFGCKGIKVRVSGRLNGAEIARSEWYLQGQLPLHTLRADLDYGFAQAYTTYGVIGDQVLDLQRRDSGKRRGAIRCATSPSRGASRCAIAANGVPGSALAPATRRNPSGAGGAGACPMPSAAPRVAPILPPLAPPQPSWKQEFKHETSRRRHPNGAPADEPPEKKRRIAWRPNAMLMPKKVKYRKQQRGRMTGKAWRGSSLAFGDFGLKALRCGWITDRQIEAARVAMTRFIKRGGKVWIRLFPDKPITKKPAETRMGKGKGAPEQWVAVIRPGKILFEMEGVPKATAEEAFRLAAGKLPLPTKVVSREATPENNTMRADKVRELDSDELRRQGRTICKSRPSVCVFR